MPFKLFFLFFVLVVCGVAQQGRVDLNFNLNDTSYNYGANGVNFVKVCNDGDILQFGTFSFFSGQECNNIVKLNPDGKINTEFDATNVSPNIFSSTTSVIETENNNFIIGASILASASTQPIVKIKSDGSVDTTFKAKFGDRSYVVNMHQLSNNKILASGVVKGYDGKDVEGLVCLDSLGDLDTTYKLLDTENYTLNISTYGNLGLKADNSGRFYLFGDFEIKSDTSSARWQGIARFYENGGIDTSFKNIKIDYPTRVEVLNDGVIVFGFFDKVNNVSKTNVAKLNLDGSLNNSFSLSVSSMGFIKATHVINGNKLLIGGSFSIQYPLNKDSLNKIFCIDSLGNLDTTFKALSILKNVVNFSSINGDEILVSGDHIINSKGVKVGALSPKNKGFDKNVKKIKQYDENRFIVIGGFSNYKEFYTPGIARLFNNGDIDSSFVSGGFIISSPSSVFPLANGKIIVSGGMYGYDGRLVKMIIRLNSDGTLDDSFNSEVNGIIRDLVELDDGRVVICGNFPNLDWYELHQLTALNTDGSVDFTFDHREGSSFRSGSVTDLYLQEDGKIIVAGSFKGNYNYKSANKIFRVDSDGKYDKSFNSGGYKWDIYSVVPLDSGEFLTIGKNIGHFSEDYFIKDHIIYWYTFYDGILQDDNKLLVRFYYDGAERYNGLARLNEDFSIDTSFNEIRDEINTINLIDTNFYIGGYFDDIQGTNRKKFVKLFLDSAAFSMDVLIVDTPGIELIGQDTIIIPCPIEAYDFDGFRFDPIETGGTWEAKSPRTKINGNEFLSLYWSSGKYHTVYYTKTIDQIEYRDTVVYELKNTKSYFLITDINTWEDDFYCGDTIRFWPNNSVDSIYFRDGIERDSFFVVESRDAIYPRIIVDGCELNRGNPNYWGRDSIDLNSRIIKEKIYIEYPAGVNAESTWGESQFKFVNSEGVKFPSFTGSDDSLFYSFDSNVVTVTMTDEFSPNQWNSYYSYYAELVGISNEDYISTFSDSSITYTGSIKYADCQEEDIRIYLRKKIQISGNSNVLLTINNNNNNRRISSGNCSGGPLEGRSIILADLKGNFIDDDTTNTYGKVKFSNIAGGEYLIFEDHLSINNQRPLQITLNPNESYVAEIGRSEGELVVCEFLTSENEIVNENQFNVFPNPTTGLIRLSKTFDSVMVYSVEGRLIKQIYSTTDSIDLSHFDTGVYLIYAKKGSITSIQKVTKR